MRENVDFLVTVEVVKAWESKHGAIPRGAWVLIRTDWSKRTGAEPFLNIARGRPAYAGLSSAVRAVPREGARHPRRRRRDRRHRRRAGRDFDPMFPCHTIMHGSNRFGLASLMNLDQLPATGAIVIAPPLKIVNGSGSPLRVLALVPG